jgi:dipeptidyl aminopeptidase/acylaminoacyl peptidase
MPFKRPKLTLLAAVAASALALAIPATATFPGKNSRIAFINASDIFTINPDGSAVQQLTPFGSNGGFVCCQAWSADGRQIVFGAEPNGTPVSQLWIMNSDGSNQRVLLSEDSFFEQWPSFSPDGSQVAFSRCTLPEGHCAIYRISVSGNDLTALTAYDPNPDVNDFVPAYSPDGKTIAFDSSTRGGVIFAIYLMNADGSNVRQLTPSAIEGANADWSPDGTTITFWTNLFEPLLSQVWTIRRDGMGLTQLTNPQNAYDSQPSWSPQQDAMVFERDNNTFTASALEIIRANGSGQNLALQSRGSKSTFVTPKERFLAKKRSGKGLQESILNSGFFPRWGALPQ